MTTNIWVAGGKGPHQIVTSPDGIIWTSSESGEAAFTGGICRAVAHNGLLDSGGLWVAVGGGYNGTPYHKIAYSTDGVKWTGSTSGNALFVGGDCVTRCPRMFAGEDHRAAQLPAARAVARRAPRRGKRHHVRACGLLADQVLKIV